MAHCPFDQLSDLESELNKIRELPKIKEPKPGVFYLKSKGFLHFHIDKEDRRWADARNGQSWGAEIDIPIRASKKTKAEFLKKVKAYYNNTYSELYS